jgi:hypothetical protein
MKNGKKRRAWTTEQVRDLKSLARKKTPARKIAKSLKRTEGATRQKALGSRWIHADSLLDKTNYKRRHLHHDAISRPATHLRGAFHIRPRRR